MKTFCLVGFGEMLDFRPIVLLQPPPRELTCVFCNVVSATPTPLPCGHQACRVCRGEVLQRGNVCPFDKVSFAKDSAVAEGKFGGNGDVVVPRIEAHCFNLPFGCPFTGTLHEIELHFPNGCSHHKVTCINCDKDVLQRLLAEHIFSGCVEHVPIAPPAASFVEECGSESSQRRLSALEKTIEERFRALLVSSAARDKSEPDTLTEEDTFPAAVRHVNAPPATPRTEASTSAGLSAYRNRSTTQRRETLSSSSTLPTSPQDVSLAEEEVALPLNGSSSSRDPSRPREVYTSRGALYVAKEDRRKKSQANGAPQDGRGASDGKLRLREYDLKLSYSDTTNGSGDRALLFKILLRDDGEHETRPKNGHGLVVDSSLPRSPGQETEAEPPLDGKLSLSLCRPGSNEDFPLPTFNLTTPEELEEREGWVVVARTAETDWEMVKQYVDVDTLRFSLRLSRF